jgi:hypothetical protein
LWYHLKIDSCHIDERAISSSSYPYKPGIFY